MIKDFFTLAKYNGKQWSGLNLTLIDYKEDPSDMKNEIAGGVADYNKFNVYDDVEVSIIGGNKSDMIFVTNAKGSSINALAGRDMVFGSAGKDIIDGGIENDVLYGSSISLSKADEKQQKLDKDVIVGGHGRDLIFGGVGDDVIFTGYKREHEQTEGNNERGDWAVGGFQNDVIYGSSNRDFLQGSEGEDYIHGGASDDVILGDGSVLFGQKLQSLTIDDTPYIPNPYYNPSGFISSVLMPNDHISADFEFHKADKQWKKTPSYTASAPHFDMDKWEVTIDRAGRDYTLKTTVPLNSQAHIVEKDGGNDELHGGSGHDLIIG